MARFDWALSKRLHQTALVMFDLFNPIVLPRSHQGMRAELLDMPV